MAAAIAVKNIGFKRKGITAAAAEPAAETDTALTSNTETGIPSATENVSQTALTAEQINTNSEQTAETVADAQQPSALAKKAARKKAGNLYFLGLCTLFGLICSAASIVVKHAAVEADALPDTLGYMFSFTLFAQTAIIAIVTVWGLIGLKKFKGVLKSRPVIFSKFCLLLLAAYAALDGFCQITGLLANAELNLVFLAPIGFGVSLILTSIADRLAFREKITRRDMIAMAVAVVASVFMILGDLI